MRWRRSPRPIRTTPRRRSSTRCRSPPPRRRPTRHSPSSSRPARSSRQLIAGAAGSPGPGALHHPQLRRSAAGRSGARGGAALREDRAVGAARAAHAVAHVHAARLLAGIDRHEHRIRRGREARALGRRRTAHDGLPRLCLPADRRRTAARDNCSTSLPEVRSRFDPDAIGSAAPGSAGVFALAAIPARYALERGAWADAAQLEPHPSKYPIHRSADPLRPRDRCRADRRHRDGSLLDRRVAGIQQQLTPAKEALLGRAGRDSAPRRDGVAGVRGTSQGGRARARCARPRRWRTAPRRRR